MKFLALLTCGFVGAFFIAEPAAAAPYHLNNLPVGQSGATLIAKKSEKKPARKHNYNSGKGYIPGHVRTPYGYGDCIGWWERHSDGRMQCHGQLILGDMHNWLWD